MNPGHLRRIRQLQTLLACAVVGLLGLAGAASAFAAGSRSVRYLGVTVSVPASWPVIRVNAGSTTCVRFNRHAVYLGTPGTQERCPLNVVGRTEAILIQPTAGTGSGLTDDGRTGALAPTSTADAAGAVGSMVRIVRPAQKAAITATWDRDPRLIQAALHLDSLAVAARATNGHRPEVAATLRKQRPSAARAGERQAHAGSTTPTAPSTPVTTTTTSTTTSSAPTTSPAAATPGEVYTGLGFDMCSAPSTASLSAWEAGSQYAAVGIYIGGTNIGCSQTNLTPAWVSAESAAGWHLIPTYVGLQAPGACSGCASISSGQAAAEGAAAAQDAVYQAQALGIGTGNPIYYDMEAYSRPQYTSMVETFLSAWTTELHASGYLSGVYSSSASGISDLVSAYGTSGFTEPDAIWFAHWGTPANTTDSYIPAADWPNDQRLHQYEGGHDETYGGVTLNIDSDYLTAATAAAGSAASDGSTAPLANIATAPALTVQPHPDGSIGLTPAWSGETGIASWQISGGPSATALTPIETIPVNQPLPVVVQDDYSYFSVTALNSAGAVLGSSQPQATPASVAIYTDSAFTPTEPGALSGGTIAVPVGCMNVSPCSVQAAMFRAHKRLAHSGMETVSGQGGTIRLPVTTGVLRALAAGKRRVVSVTVGTSAGITATRTLELIPYATSGPAPVRRTGANSSLAILAKAVFVSNGWVGGVLVQCNAPTPCTATTSVTTRSGRLVLATPRTQTVGSGEIADLTFKMTAAGHRLLRTDHGNQLPARVTVTTPTAAGAVTASTAQRSTPATALVSLDSF